jgi:hypothetical protein
MKTLTIAGTSQAVIAAFAFLSLAGCGDYFSLLSGQEACSKWTGQQKPENTLHEASTKWAEAFFPAFAKKYCEKTQCKALQFPQANAQVLGSLNAYCASNPNDTIMTAATRTMVAALRPA